MTRQASQMIAAVASLNAAAAAQQQQIIFLQNAAAQLVATATSAATLMSRGTPGAGDATAWAQAQTDIADRAGRLTGMGCKP